VKSVKEWNNNFRDLMSKQQKIWGKLKKCRMSRPKLLSCLEKLEKECCALGDFIQKKHMTIQSIKERLSIAANVTATELKNRILLENKQMEELKNQYEDFFISDSSSEKQRSFVVSYLISLQDKIASLN
jgi:hypothetical protein